MKQIFIRRAIKEDLTNIQKLSQQWAEEKITYDYSATEVEELEKYSMWVAEVDGEIAGYLAGERYNSKNMQSIMPVGSACFEVEEFYVTKENRKRGIGKMLYDTVIQQLEDEGMSYVTLVAANKDSQKLLDFYEREAMQVFSTRLFKKL